MSPKRDNTITRTVPGYPEAQRAARYIEQRIDLKPRVGIILGSGLGEVAAHLGDARRLLYNSIPSFPRATVRGHAGELHAGFWDRLPVAILAGRMHLYEGYSPAQVVFPTRVLALLGVEILIVTCAAGGIAPKAVPGSLMVLSDHINAQGSNPLVGPSWVGPGSRDDFAGQAERFVDMTQAYDPALRRLAARAASKLRLKWFEGVYLALLGPSFETPAEIRAFARWGADAVGMSTVPEVVAARQLAVRVLGLASITNRAAGLTNRALSHHEVLEAGKLASKGLANLLDKLLSEV